MTLITLFKVNTITWNETKISKNITSIKCIVAIYTDICTIMCINEISFYSIVLYGSYLFTKKELLKEKQK